MKQKSWRVNMPIKEEVLKKYMGDIFVETGTQFGDGIDLALKVGFKRAFSVEIVKHVYEKAVIKYTNNPNVNLFLGNSAEKISEILDIIESNYSEETVVFWLDAHINGSQDMDTHTNGGKDMDISKSVCPVLVELEKILPRNFKKVILIDDMRLFRKSRNIWGNIQEAQIIDTIKAQETENKKYLISYDNGMRRNDILVVREAI